MDVKTRLQRLQLLDTVINQKLRELESLKALSTCVAGFDTSRERVQTSGSGDAPFVTPVLRIIALEEEINKEIDAFVDEKHKIIQVIQRLDSPLQMEVLYRRYVEYQSFERIAAEMNIVQQHAFVLHRKGLKALEKICII
nr:MAG TPA: Protein of unknown function (DUF1492) [Caudoviricetes sp.]